MDQDPENSRSQIYFGGVLIGDDAKICDIGVIKGFMTVFH
jgi:hypothetical protein